MEAPKTLAAGHCLSTLENLIGHWLEGDLTLSKEFLGLLTEMSSSHIEGTLDEFERLCSVIEEDAKQLGLQSHVCVSDLLLKLTNERHLRAPRAAGPGGSVISHRFGLPLNDCVCA